MAAKKYKSVSISDENYEKLKQAAALRAEKIKAPVSVDTMIAALLSYWEKGE